MRTRTNPYPVGPWLFAGLILSTGAQAQKHPVPGDPKRTIQVFEVQDLVRTTPVKADAKKSGVPVLSRIPILGDMFRRKGDAEARGSGFTADKVRLGTLVRFVEGFIEPRLADGEEVKSLGRANLLALATPEKLAWITRFLAENRKLGDDRIEVDTRFLIVSPFVFRTFVLPRLEASDRVVSRDEKKRRQQSVAGPAGSLVNTFFRMPRAVINKFALLADAKEREKFLIGLVQQKGVRLLNTPSISAFPMTRAHLLLGRKTTFIKDVVVEVTENAFIADPIVGTVTDGLFFGCTVALLRKDVIGMDLEFSNSVLKLPIKKVTTTVVKGSKPITIELPELSLAKLESRVELAMDQTALFALAGPNDSYVLALIRATVTRKKDK